MLISQTSREVVVMEWGLEASIITVNVMLVPLRSIQSEGEGEESICTEGTQVFHLGYSDTLRMALKTRGAGAWTVVA